MKDLKPFLSLSASKPNFRDIHNVNEVMKCEVLFSSLWRGVVNLEKFIAIKDVYKKSYLFLIPNQTDKKKNLHKDVINLLCLSWTYNIM